MILVSDYIKPLSKEDSLRAVAFMDSLSYATKDSFLVVFTVVSLHKDRIEHNLRKARIDKLDSGYVADYLIDNENGIKLYNGLMKLYDWGIQFSDSEVTRRKFIQAKKPDGRESWLKHRLGNKSVDSGLEFLMDLSKDLYAISVLKSKYDLR